MANQLWWIEYAGDGWWECVRYPHTHLTSIGFEPVIDYVVEYDDDGSEAIVWVFTFSPDEKRGEIKDVIQHMVNIPVHVRVFMRREGVDLRDGNVRKKKK